MRAVISDRINGDLRALSVKNQVEFITKGALPSVNVVGRQVFAQARSSRIKNHTGVWRIRRLKFMDISCA